MLPIEPSPAILARNRTLRVVRIKSPEGVPEEECGTVVALVGSYPGGIFDGGPVIRTYWKPSDEEIEFLKKGAFVELDFFTNEMPMTAMNVEVP